MREWDGGKGENMRDREGEGSREGIRERERGRERDGGSRFM